jgi:hypothetical protein
MKGWHEFGQTIVVNHLWPFGVVAGPEWLQASLMAQLSTNYKVLGRLGRFQHRLTRESQPIVST